MKEEIYGNAVEVRRKSDRVTATVLTLRIEAMRIICADGPQSIRPDTKKDTKLYMCFVDMGKTFDRVPKKVMEWAMRKKGLSEVMIRAVMSLYDGAKTRVRVGFA